MSEMSISLFGMRSKKTMTDRVVQYAQQFIRNGDLYDKHGNAKSWDELFVDFYEKKLKTTMIELSKEQMISIFSKLIKRDGSKWIIRQGNA